MPQPQKKNIEIEFPVGGIAEGASHTNQPEGTTHSAKNVVPFDTSEDRPRGGRRRGIKKTTDSPLESNSIQLLIGTDIPNSSGELSSGGVTEFGEDSAFAGQKGILDYSALPNGTQIDESTLGHTLYGASGTAARNAQGTGTTAHLVDNTDVTVSAASYNFPVLSFMSEGTDGYKQRPVLLSSGNNSSFKGLTKQEDSSGIPYLLVDPASFEFNRTTFNGYRHANHSVSSGGLFHPTGSNAMENPTTDFFDTDDTINVYKFCSLYPEHDFGEKPWNAAPDKTFATKFEFQLPEGSTHSYPNGEVTYVSSIALEDDEGKLYDPYYNTHVGAPATAAQNLFKPYDIYAEYVGLIFRVGTNYDLVKNAAVKEDWVYDYHLNGSSDGAGGTTPSGKAALVVYFERNAGASSDGDISGNYWNLTVRSVTGHLTSMWGSTTTAETILTEAIAANDRNYHTLEVRCNNNRIDIVLDGLIVKHYDDIRTTFSDLTNDAGTDLTDSFGYGGFWHNKTQRITRLGDSGGSHLTKKQVSYFCSYDFNTRKDANGDSVESTHTDDRGGSGAWRIRNLSWLEASRNASATRVVMAITNGNIHESDNGSAFTKVGTAQAVDELARTVDGISYLSKIYLVDGKNYRVYDPDTNAVSDWSATDTITLPGGDGPEGLNGNGTYDSNPRCSIIEVYNARVVMAGKSDEPNNWFMSAIGEPDNWDISQNIPDGGAITGSSSTIGESSDAITALAPMTDDRLLIGGTNSVHIMTGDPSSEDTQLISISKDVGIVGQDAWCHGPNKSVYFMGTNGFYNLQPNEFDIALSNRISLGKLDTTLSLVDFSTNHCRLMYDQNMYGVHIFLTPHTRSGNPLRHFFYDTRAEGFWEMEMPSVVGPTAAIDYQDLDPDNRKILLGGYDGHMRMFDTSAKDDDGTAIDSFVWLGPLQIGGDREIKLTQLIAILDEQTSGLSYEIYAADTVEAAKAGTPIITGDWVAGRNGANKMRVRGAAVFVRLKSSSVSTPWAIENLIATLTVAGKVRQR